MENETIWLTQAQIAELFGTKRPAITKHINNIYSSNELEANSTCSILEHMGNDGNQKYTTKYYNLDVILSVGYRVNSLNATRFRQWANKVLKEYIPGVSAKIYTANISKQLTLDLAKHNKQYPPIEIFMHTTSHDRFLIIDDAEVYHIGASLKDLGKKLFAFSKLNIPPGAIL